MIIENIFRGENLKWLTFFRFEIDVISNHFFVLRIQNPFSKSVNWILDMTFQSMNIRSTQIMNFPAWNNLVIYPKCQRITKSVIWWWFLYSAFFIWRNNVEIDVQVFWCLIPNLTVRTIRIKKFFRIEIQEKKNSWSRISTCIGMNQILLQYFYGRDQICLQS